MAVFGFFSIGVLELLVLAVLLLIAAALIGICWMIAVKAGLPGPMGLVTIVPVFGLILFLVLLLVLDWPATRRIQRSYDDER